MKIREIILKIIKKLKFMVGTMICRTLLPVVKLQLALERTKFNFLDKTLKHFIEELKK
jgi:hypothetical protein